MAVRADDRQLSKCDAAPMPPRASQRNSVVDVGIVPPEDTVPALKIEAATWDFAPELLSELEDRQDFPAPQSSLPPSVHDEPLLFFALQRFKIFKDLVIEPCIGCSAPLCGDMCEVSEARVLTEKDGVRWPWRRSARSPAAHSLASRPYRHTRPFARRYQESVALCCNHP